MSKKFHCKPSNNIISSQWIWASHSTSILIQPFLIRSTKWSQFNFPKLLQNPDKLFLSPVHITQLTFYFVLKNLQFNAPHLHVQFFMLLCPFNVRLWNKFSLPRRELFPRIHLLFKTPFKWKFIMTLFYAFILVWKSLCNVYNHDVDDIIKFKSPATPKAPSNREAMLNLFHLNLKFSNYD